MPVSLATMTILGTSSYNIALAEAATAATLPASVVYGLKVLPPACFFFLQVSGCVYFALVSDRQA